MCVQHVRSKTSGKAQVCDNVAALQNRVLPKYERAETYLELEMRTLLELEQPTLSKFDKVVSLIRILLLEFLSVGFVAVRNYHSFVELRQLYIVEQCQVLKVDPF